MKTTTFSRFIMLALCCAYSHVYYSQKNAEKADRYFDQNQFQPAIRYYQLETKSGNRKAAERAWQKLADCYRITGEFEKAEETYKKILKKKKKDPVNYMNYGLSLKSSAKYAEAIEQFKEYQRLKPEDPMGVVFLESCDSAQKWLDETIGKEAKNLEKINTELAEFSPTFYNSNKIFFSSSRKGSKEALISFDGGGEMHRLDLYSVELDEIEKDNKQNELIQNFKSLNTALHEGPACFNSDGTEIYFTKTIKGKKDRGTNSILNTLQIFYSHQDSSGKWTKPVSAFSFNSLNYSVGHPALNGDGSRIYYMSDKPGGHGKTDIYYSNRLSNGAWGEPVNAGSILNTFGHELFPYISVTGELFFSSNSHPGMGQLDIFKAVQDSNGKITHVVNLKPPINSIGNDFGIVFEKDAQRGFFSSDRFNGKGAEDLYSFSEDEILDLKIGDSTLFFSDKALFDDISYRLMNLKDSSVRELTPVAGVYSVALGGTIHLELLARKNGGSYNKISITNLDTTGRSFELRSNNRIISITAINTLTHEADGIVCENGKIFIVPGESSVVRRK